MRGITLRKAGSDGAEGRLDTHHPPGQRITTSAMALPVLWSYWTPTGRVIRLKPVLVSPHVHGDRLQSSQGEPPSRTCVGAAVHPRQAALESAVQRIRAADASHSTAARG
jgi:hypothetical protein